MAFGGLIWLRHAFFALRVARRTRIKKNTPIGLSYNNQWVEIAFQICAYAGMQLHPSSIWPQLAAPLGCSASRVIFASIEHWEAGQTAMPRMRLALDMPSTTGTRFPRNHEGKQCPDF
jgi:hypothetical protein